MPSEIGQTDAHRETGLFWHFIDAHPRRSRNILPRHQKNFLADVSLEIFRPGFHKQTGNQIPTIVILQVETTNVDAATRKFRASAIEDAIDPKAMEARNIRQALLS